ncbi:hypothetical protein QJS66_00465 [Kocuria rhizophila]|nr:hypothetical protein QJS66_00465 [Kocuria rhizophila]
MTTENTPKLLARDQGLDATSHRYPDLVRGVVLAPWIAAGTDRPDQATQLAARTVAALDEVAGWAKRRPECRPTACAWLSYLRWAVAPTGAQLPDDAPHPPSDDLDRHRPVLAAPEGAPATPSTRWPPAGSERSCDLCFPAADSPEVLARTAPTAWSPPSGGKPSWPSPWILGRHHPRQPGERTRRRWAWPSRLHAAARAAETGATVQERADRDRGRAPSSPARRPTLEPPAQCAEPVLTARCWPRHRISPYEASTWC